MKISILGGGISGLSAAYYALKKYPQAKITLFEKSDRLGGWIETTEVDGFLFERGPRTFVVGRCPLLLEMIHELGLEVRYSEPGKRYLLHRGKVRPLRSFWHVLAGAMCRHFVLPNGKREDETVYEFGCRRFGRKATELFLDPLAKGIYGGDIRTLSKQACFPSLFHRPKDTRLFTLKNGLQSLVDALARLPIDIRLNTSGTLDSADLVISALPAPEISRLSGIEFLVRYEPIHVVNLGYRGSVLPLKGYGYLVPSQENESLLGMIWDTEIFSVEGQTKVTAMVRGDKPLETALGAMRRHLGVTQQSLATLTKQTWLPQYEVGHSLQVKRFEATMRQKWPQVRVVGNFLAGPAVESCLRTSNESL